MDISSSSSFDEFEKLYKAAGEEGLHYVYTPLHRNTYCQNCNELLIERDFRGPTDWKVTSRLCSDNTCPKCGQKTVIIGKCHHSKAKPIPPSAIGRGWIFYWGFEG
jgi:hypothetical protein